MKSYNQQTISFDVVDCEFAFSLFAAIVDKWIEPE